MQRKPKSVYLRAPHDLLQVRMPEGTTARIKAVRGYEGQTSWLRRLVLDALTAEEQSVSKRRA